MLGLAWLVHGWVLSQLLWLGLPRLAERAGYGATLSTVNARFFAPVRLGEIELKCPAGTLLRASAADLAWAPWADWGLSPATWIGRLSVRGLSGRMMLAPPQPRESGEATPVRTGISAAVWPRVVELSGADLTLAGRDWSVGLRGLDLLLDEARIGFLRVRQTEVGGGRWNRTFPDLQAVTAWRGGVAYFADLALDENVALDSLSIALAGASALKLEARVGEGYVYADVSREATGLKAAVNMLNVSLERVAAFAGVDGDMEGTVDLAKLTFNGDPARPLSGQVSLRVEAKDFSWRKNAVEELILGLSVAGRRVRVNECWLRQKSNLVRWRGTVAIPPDPAGWRQAPFDFEVAAEVRDLRALAGLFGAPWNELSGGLTLDGQGSGRAADGEGWLRVRGWDLRARGVPGSSLQADFSLGGRDLRLTSLHAQSGPNFLRGHGRLSLDDSLTYQGRLELRVREVARYLEPLGRFAPDWAREGGGLLFWDGDGTATAHSGVATLELVRFTGDLNPVPVNGQLSASYSPGNIYVSRFLLDRGPLSLSSSLYFGGKGLSVQDIQLFSGRSRLLRGELFLPLSLEAVLARRPWEETVMAGRDVYAFLRSDDVDLASLVQLFGQETTLRGRAELRLDASGPWENAELDGLLSVTGLAADFPALKIPASRASLSVKIKERQAAVAAQLQPQGAAALTLQATLPLVGQTPDGHPTLLDSAEPWQAQLEIPPTDLAKFLPACPGVVQLTGGSVHGKITADRTLEQPHWNGSLTLRDVRLEFPAGWAPVEALQGRVVFEETRIVLAETSARSGEGTFGLAGRVDFADRRHPAWEIRLHGEGMKFYEDENIRWQGRPDLEARGNHDGGEVTGSIDLSGTSVRRGLAAAPQLGPASETAAAAPLRLTAQPFAAWRLDVQATSSAAWPVGPDGVDGALQPDLYLQGTLGEPLLLGTVQVSGLQVVFPSRIPLTAAGSVHFTRAQPWLPVADLTGAGKAGPYDIQAGLFGPLGGQNLFLSSTPALEAGQIVLLLTTGVSPVPASGGAAPQLDAEAKLTSEPSWLDLDRIRGLLGWSTGESGGFESAEESEWARPAAAVGYEWGFR